MRLFLGVVGRILRQASPGSFGIFMELANGWSPQPVFASCRNGTAFCGSSGGRVVLGVIRGHSPGCCWSSVDGIFCECLRREHFLQGFCQSGVRSVVRLRSPVPWVGVRGSVGCRGCVRLTRQKLILIFIRIKVRLRKVRYQVSLK